MPRAAHAERRRRAPATEFVALDTRACEVCWECVEACPDGVLGKVDLGRVHRHARIADAEACTGCLKCVRVCEAGALSRLDR